MDSPRARQAAFNASSRDQWESFAPHRQRVCALLGAGTGARSSRLCVLGVGNGLDLDLAALLETYDQVHLVDLDAAALREGVTRQGIGDSPRLRLFGGIDVSTMLDALSAWSPGTLIGPSELEGLVEGPARRVPSALGGPYDIVASTCLLRPLIGNVFHSVGTGHPRFSAMVRAIRAGHLRLLARLLAPGGRAVLITDVVSSETLPELEHLPQSSLPYLLERLDREANFFHGVGPAELAASLAKDPVLAAQTVDRRSYDPWRWRLHGRVYLVWALSFRVPSLDLEAGFAADRPAHR